MVHNSIEILKKDGKDCNHLRHMWLFISTIRLLIQSISEYVKLAKLGMCQVLGFVKVEHCFNTLFFMKGKLCNYLSSQLDLCVKMFSQDFYNIESFPYIQVIATRKENKIHYSVRSRNLKSLWHSMGFGVQILASIFRFWILELILWVVCTWQYAFVG
jgi:hypothetical protein